MKTPIHAFTITIVVLVFAWLMIERAQADTNPYTMDLFPSQGAPEPSGDNSFYKGDGSLVNVYGAKKSGMVVKDGEVEYYVEPKDDGSPTFIYDNELIICTNSGCY